MVHKFSYPRHIVTVVEVKTPDGVGCRLVAEVVLLRKRLFAQVHKGGSKIEVGVELIVEVQAEHTLGHHRERAVLAAYADRCARCKQALVDDTHRTHSVVNCIVNILNERHSSGCHGDRALCHAVAKLYLAADRAGIVAFKVKLVLVGILLSQGLCHCVERVEAILVGQSVIAQHLAQVLAERFHVREEYSSRRSLNDTAFVCGAVKPVEHAVGVIVALRCIHSVKSKHLYKRNCLERAFGEIADAYAALGVLVQHIEAEVLAA